MSHPHRVSTRPFHETGILTGRDFCRPSSLNISPLISPRWQTFPKTWVLSLFARVFCLNLDFFEFLSARVLKRPTLVFLMSGKHSLCILFKSYCVYRWNIWKLKHLTRLGFGISSHIQAETVHYYIKHASGSFKEMNILWLEVIFRCL